MRKAIFALLTLGLFQVSAQDLPAPSPFSKLEQRVGLTDFTVEYSRPGVKGREIYGELVPFDKIWRTGANKATALSFNTSAMIGGKEVPAGKYSIFTIPGEETWIFILNKNTELYGTNEYEEAKDVVRLEVNSMKSSMTETFTVDIQDINDGKANLVIRWADRAIQVPIMVDVQQKAMSNIKDALANSKEEDLWRVNRNAATYYSRNDIDQKRALELIKTSIELKKDSWYSHYVHGEILDRMGDSKGAVAAAEMAMEVGMTAADNAGTEFGYSDMIKEAMKEWSDK